VTKTYCVSERRGRVVGGEMIAGRGVLVLPLTGLVARDRIGDGLGETPVSRLGVVFTAKTDHGYGVAR
jgi:hypothetical protein